MNITEEEQSLIILAIRETITAYTFTAPKLPVLVSEKVHSELTATAGKMLELEAKLLQEFNL